MTYVSHMNRMKSILRRRSKNNYCNFTFNDDDANLLFLPTVVLIDDKITETLL